MTISSVIHKAPLIYGTAHRGNDRLASESQKATWHDGFQGGHVAGRCILGKALWQQRCTIGHSCRALWALEKGQRQDGRDEDKRACKGTGCPDSRLWRRGGVCSFLCYRAYRSGTLPLGLGWPLQQTRRCNPSWIGAEVEGYIGRYGLDAGNGAPLCAACATGCKDIVKDLLARGAHAKASENAPIILAVEGGDEETVGMLVQAGANIDARDGQPLAIAASKGNLPMLHSLIRMGASPNIYYDSALVAAASKGHTDVVDCLVSQYGARVSARGHGALLAASAGGHVAVVNYLLSLEPPTGRLFLGRAMREAAINGHREVVDALQARGASWRDVFEDNSDPQYLAEGPAEVVLYGLSNGLGIGWSLEEFIVHASSLGRLGDVRAMLEHSPDRSEHTDTAILFALQARHAEMAKALLAERTGEFTPVLKDALCGLALHAGSAELLEMSREMGGTVMDKDMQAIVFNAAESGSVCHMQWLIDQNVPVALYATDALEHAMRSSNAEMVEFLLENGANLSDDIAEVCYKSAIEYSNVPALRLLIERLPGHVLDYEGCLLFAAENDSMEMVQFIDEWLFSLTDTAPINKALMRAVLAGNVEMVRYLESVGGDIVQDNKTIRHAIAVGNTEMTLFLLAHDDFKNFDNFMKALRAYMRTGSSADCKRYLAILSNDIAI